MKRYTGLFSIIMIVMLVCTTVSFSAGETAVGSEGAGVTEAAAGNAADAAAAGVSDANGNAAVTGTSGAAESKAADTKAPDTGETARTGDANGDTANDGDTNEGESNENGANESVNVSYQAAGIQTQIVDGQNWLFLPSNADKHKLKLDFTRNGIEISGDVEVSGDAEVSSDDEVSGDAEVSGDDEVSGDAEVSCDIDEKKIKVSSGSEFDVSSLFESEPSDGIYRLKFDDTPVNIMFSENIAAVYIKSKDAAKNRIWVENDKKNKAKGSMKMINADGSIVYDGDLTQIKGRGNSSWNCIKKPYQIKLAEPTDLQETGINSEKNKTWVLLAGYTDHTLLHNQFTYDAAEAMEMKFTPHCRQINLYYDGEYRGVYLLIEKTEVGSGRVEVKDLEKEIEEENSDISDFDILDQVEMTSDQGTTCHYIDKLRKTDDVTGGYLLEMDYTDRAAEEKSWIKTKNGQAVVVKSPEYVPKENMEYIASLYQEFEDAAYNGGTNPTNHKSYTDMIDVESLAKVYILEELSMDQDAFSSSNYIYKTDGKNSKLTFGPVWDFDSGYGDLGSGSSRMANIECLGAANSKLMEAMLKIPSFQNTVKEVYNRYFSKIKKINGSVLEEHMAEISAATRMNSVLWPKNTTSDGSQAQVLMQNFINLRSSYLYYTINEWDGTSVKSYDFYDVYTSDWYIEDVRYAAKNGIFNGTNPGYFSPNSNMTRAMAVTVLYRIAGSPETPAGIGENTASDEAAVDNAALDGAAVDNAAFDDVANGMWYADAVAWAVRKGIVNGTGNDKFSPNEQISRQDFVSMLYRYIMSESSADEKLAGTGENSTESATLAKVKNKTSSKKSNKESSKYDSKYENIKKFTDFSSISDYALEAFSWSVKNGITEGNDRNMISPTATVNRAQAAAIIHRALLLKSNATDAEK